MNKEALVSGGIDIVEHTHKVLEECRKINEEYHYFTVISEEKAIAQAKNLKNKLEHNDPAIKQKRLLGIFISAKDAICVQGVESTAGSRILGGYKPLFDATVIKKAQQEGAIIIGKTSQDEFGFGSFSVNVGLGMQIPKNPFDKERTCGGSSGGAGGITKKASFSHIALGESTGGSIAAPASFCGVFGLTPTYGRVSRYGLMDYGNSLDKIGTLGKTMHDAALLLEVISGFDENESTSLNVPKESFSSHVGKDIKGKKIGVIKETMGSGLEPDIEKVMRHGITQLEHAGASVEEISLELPIKYGLSAYYLIATSEASTNLAKYCGIRYGTSEKLEGNFNDYFSTVRSKNFGSEAKRRIMLGTFARMSGYRDAYYLKALKVRTKIIQEYKKKFEKFDALISPSSPMLPPKFSEIEKLTPLQHYLADIMVVSPNLAGLPHVSVPVGSVGNLPIGMLLIGDHLNEKTLIEIGSVFDKQ